MPRLPSIVIYRGPSRIDGRPIVALASVGSRNAKTGPMIQTWIHVDDKANRSAHEIRSLGRDASVCGSCPRRPVLARNAAITPCYVMAYSFGSWAKFSRNRRAARGWRHPSVLPYLQRAASEHGLRIGSYGDPAAVPADVWAELIGALQPARLTGYTHQWNALPPERAAKYRGWLMASVDSAAEAAAARRAGWRYFAAVPDAQSAPAGAILCPATRPGSDTRCEDCGACDGIRRGDRKPSIYLAEHGPGSSASSRARRVAALAVIQ